MSCKLIQKVGSRNRRHSEREKKPLWRFAESVSHRGKLGGNRWQEQNLTKGSKKEAGSNGIEELEQASV